MGEKRMVGRLLGRRRELVLKNKNYKKIRAARKALKNFLKAEYQAANFATNWGWFIFGLVIILITIIGLGFSANDGGAVGFISLWLSIWSFGCFALLEKVFIAFKEALSGSLAGIVRTIGLAVFSFPFVAGEVIGISILAEQIGYAATIGLALQGVLALAFYQWLQAPTHAGRKLMDEIEGFRLYLEVAEQPRLEALHPPKETLDLFERYLPYALALDVENAWCTRFESQIAAATAGPSEGRYRPRWYSGRSWDSGRSLTDLGKTLGQSLGAAAGAAATAPGSSSGSGGGGSSGGGGGGGGGSGW